jgi:hypothetical protein
MQMWALLGLAERQVAQTAPLARTLGLIKVQMPYPLMELMVQLRKQAAAIRQRLEGLEGLLYPVLATQSMQVGLGGPALA